MTYPKRLIEVDLPIREISAHARREKSIRHGHISTLHIWWARRPLAACRAVTCAALWPDPADEFCPPTFRNAAAKTMVEFAAKVRADRDLLALCQSHWARWNRMSEGSLCGDDPATWWDLRYALLDFIAEFANWDASTVPAFLETARALTQASHEALGGASGTRPFVVDPFAGGGAIPLEALRVGADAFASDLNPVAVLLNKVVLEYIPRYGTADITARDAGGKERAFHGLAEAVRYWGSWIKEQAEKELAQFYPKDPDGAMPIAYLWARTIRCEAPGCGAEVPLVRSLWLAKKANQSVALQLVTQPKGKHVGFRIVFKERGGWVEKDEPNARIDNPVFDGTVKRGSATCPCCGYTTPVGRVREQLKSSRGGADNARLFCVVTMPPDSKTRGYRIANDRDLATYKASQAMLEKEIRTSSGNGPSPVPDEVIPMTEIRRISVPIYGMATWGDLFSARQALAMTTLVRLLGSARERMGSDDPQFMAAVTTVLGLAISRFADICNALCMWETSKTQVRHMFTRQAIGMLWDFAEPNIFADAAGDFAVTLRTMVKVLENQATSPNTGQVEQASATEHPLPGDSANALFTDPPYYDAVPYAHLSDFFFVWLRRALSDTHPRLFCGSEVPKVDEVVVDRPHELSESQKNVGFYERELTRAFAEARRILRPDGIGTIVFASKTTASWEAILKAVVEAGWVITGSWPIDTELGNRVAAMGQARLASSVHLACRPRENPDGSVRNDDVGDWRQVLGELPGRIHDWMPRLAREGVVGADAIFACLGPALEIFSRFSYVEKATGERVELKEFLEHVWAAVAREALTMIFEDADATGLEEDARLTAMWLWTLSTTVNGSGSEQELDDEGGGEDESPKTKLSGGFSLEFDAARKIAQGLGAHLENLTNLVEIKGDQARLLPVGERTKYLFGKDVRQQAPPTRRGKPKQMTLFAELEAAEEEAGWGETGIPAAGETTLDRVHQAMILFAAGRAEALKRFLVEEGVGRDTKVWKLAQSLSALYPAGTEEKRWVDGVLARKKSLGFG